MSSELSLEKAKNHLKKYSLDDKIKLFDVSSATVELAAAALGCTNAEIAKSMTFMVQDKPIMVICAGDCKIDNAKYKTQFHTKAVMLRFEQVEALIGYAVGGVCPFGINDGVSVYLDNSLKRFSVLYPAAGTPNSAVELTLAELSAAAEPVSWVDVTKIV